VVLVVVADTNGKDKLYRFTEADQNQYVMSTPTHHVIEMYGD